MCTAAPDKCHLLRLSKVADTASRTAEHLPRTGMQQGMCVSRPHQIPACHISTDPSAAVVLSVSWAAGEQVCSYPSAGLSQGLATACPEAWQSPGVSLPNASQGSSEQWFSNKHFQFSTPESTWTKAMARSPNKWIKLTFSENKWKNHSIDICYEFL